MRLQLGDAEWSDVEELEHWGVAVGEVERHEFDSGERTEGAGHALQSVSELHMRKGTMMEKRQVLMAPPM